MPLTKPLHSYEQSMLLVAMLFDRKNLPELMRLLPDEQRNRMLSAQEKFAKLERNERMTQIILELRRLLLIDEHRIDWIHQSWIDDALSKEPAYLKPIIMESILHRAQKGNEASDNEARVPLPLIFSTFVDQLTKAPPKTAIFDPVLMRLQSTRDDEQEEVIKVIGRTTLSALIQHLDVNRFCRLLQKRGYAVSAFDELDMISNPFIEQPPRRFFVRELFRLKPKRAEDLELNAGMIATALYLSVHKYQWQRVIVLGLRKPLGQGIEAHIKRARHVLDKPSHALLSGLITAAFRGVGG